MLHVNTIRAINEHTRKFLLLGLVFGAMALPGASVSAATFTVNATRDTHDAWPGDGVCRDTGTTPKCSLRAAIEESNARPGLDTIKLSGKTYALSLGTLQVTEPVSILGVSRTSTRIDAKKLSRVFWIGESEWVFVAYFADLTIQNGKPTLPDGKPSSTPGGGVYVYNGFFQGDRVAITGNESRVQGGGVAVGNGDGFRCTDCMINGNTTATGGGHLASGGGLFINSTGWAGLYRTTINDNSAVRGGGIAGGGYLEMDEGTISRNTAEAGGGGIKTMYPDADWWIGFSTITHNTASTATNPAEPDLGGGVFHTAGRLQIGKTIIAGNSNGGYHTDPNFSPDCATTSSTGPFQVNMALISHWDNIYGNLGNLCTAVNVEDGGDVSGYDKWGYGASTLDVKLGYLSPNGGDVWTHKLLPGSIAIDDADSGNPTGDWLFACESADATQTSRPQGAYCDVGSYEAR